MGKGNHLSKVHRYLGDFDQDKNEDIYASANSLISFMFELRDTIQEFRVGLRNIYQSYIKAVGGKDKKLIVPFESFNKAVRQYERIRKLLDEFLKAFSFDYLDVEQLLGEVNLVRQQHTNLMNRYKKIEDLNTKTGYRLAHQLLLIENKRDKLTTQLEKRILNFSALQRHLKDKVIVYQSFAGKKFTISISSNVEDLKRIFEFDKVSMDRNTLDRSLFENLKDKLQKLAEETNLKFATAASKEQQEEPEFEKPQHDSETDPMNQEILERIKLKSAELDKEIARVGKNDAKESEPSASNPDFDEEQEDWNEEMSGLELDQSMVDDYNRSALPSFISSITESELEESQVFLSAVSPDKMDLFIKRMKDEWVILNDARRLPEFDYFYDFIQDQPYLFPITHNSDKVADLIEKYGKMTRLEALLTKNKDELVNSLDFILNSNVSEKTAQQFEYLNDKFEITQVGYHFVNYGIDKVVSELVSEYKKKSYESVTFLKNNIYEIRFLVDQFTMMLFMQKKELKILKDRIDFIKSRHAIKKNDAENDRKQYIEEINRVFERIVMVDYKILEKLQQLFDHDSVKFVQSTQKILKELLEELEENKRKYETKRQQYYERYLKNGKKSVVFKN